MPEIADVLENYKYAETITRALAGGEITVELAEAHIVRNPDFATATMEDCKRLGISIFDDMPEEERIPTFCKTILKSWDLTQDGEPIAPADAAPFLSGTRAGLLLFREMQILSKTSTLFFEGTSKKKQSSTSTASVTSSAKKPKTSSSKRPREAAKSRKGSPTTSKASNNG